MKTRVFVSFDYDHDQSLKALLVGQARNEDSPFQLADWSIKEHIDYNWRNKARTRINSVDLMCVICGRYTDTATGVSAELEIAQMCNIPYFLLSGYSDGSAKKPRAAQTHDKIFAWTWENLKALIGGNR